MVASHMKCNDKIHNVMTVTSLTAQKIKEMGGVIPTTNFIIDSYPTKLIDK